MKHTNKNHKRRNNKKRQTKKYKGGDNKEGEEKEGEQISKYKGWLSNTFNNITKFRRGTPTDGNPAISENASGNSTDLDAKANELFRKLDTSEDGKLSEEEYDEVKKMFPGAKNIPYEQVDPKNDGIDFNKFLPLYYFLKASGDDAKITTDTEYNEVKKMLPGAKEIDFLVAAQGDVSYTIDFHKFLPLYYFLKASGDDAKITESEYTNLQRMLPDKFKSVAFTNVNRNNEIDFIKFLDIYNKPKTGGRRRRKRSTRNKRKTNKKRRTVKRRKSAKKSHRRK